jgi:hypothetical protein
MEQAGFVVRERPGILFSRTVVIGLAGARGAGSAS